MAIAKEREDTAIGTLSARELVSDIPKFNFERARQAASLLHIKGIPGYPALNLALALAIYNQVELDIKEAFPFTEKRLSRLIDRELIASDPKNPLPTIGFEVESARKPFDKERDSIGYSYFFDAIGMPRNKANAGIKAAIFWEFSPPPSYSASVQTRILHELLAGDFIPSLRYFKQPEDIAEYLDDKLVSLHINLGVPNLIQRNVVNLWGDPDVQYLGSMFAFAFTSPLRLEKRSQAVYVTSKDADPTSKSGGSGRRLEIKALEVRTESTYRLMEEIQLLGASLFAYLDDYEPPLAASWVRIREEVQKMYQYYNVVPDLLKDNKSQAAKVVADTSISQTLRGIITRAALDIRSLINPLSQRGPWWGIKLLF